jgi:hypothetical protein
MLNRRYAELFEWLGSTTVSAPRYAAMLNRRYAELFEWLGSATVSAPRCAAMLNRRYAERRGRRRPERAGDVAAAHSGAMIDYPRAARIPPIPELSRFAPARENESGSDRFPSAYHATSASAGGIQVDTIQ